MVFCKQKIVERAIEPINIQPNIKWVIETPICFLLCFFSFLFDCKKLHIALVWVWWFGALAIRQHVHEAINATQRMNGNFECVCVSRGCECERFHLASDCRRRASNKTRAVSNSHTRNRRTVLFHIQLMRLIVGAWLFSSEKKLSTRVG